MGEFWPVLVLAGEKSICGFGKPFSTSALPLLLRLLLNICLSEFLLPEFWAPPHYSLNRPPPRPPPCLCSAQNLTQWSQLILLISFQSLWDPPRYSLNHPPPRPLPCLFSAQNLTQWSLLIFGSACPFSITQKSQFVAALRPP
jgi:hypothetical protein